MRFRCEHVTVNHPGHPAHTSGVLAPHRNPVGYGVHSFHHIGVVHVGKPVDHPLKRLQPAVKQRHEGFGRPVPQETVGRGKKPRKRYRG